jgi:hypothetical protein
MNLLVWVSIVAFLVPDASVVWSKSISASAAATSFWEEGEEVDLAMLQPADAIGKEKLGGTRSRNTQDEYMSLRIDQEAYPGEMFLHVHVPKTGGTALIRALNKKNCGLPSYSYNASVRCRAVKHAQRLVAEQRVWWDSAHGIRCNTTNALAVAVPRPRCSVYSFEYDSLPDLLEAIALTELKKSKDAEKLQGPVTAAASGGASRPPCPAPPPRLLTIVRQPMLHLLSVYRHIRKYLKLRRCASLADLISGRCTLRRFDDMQTRQLGAPAAPRCSWMAAEGGATSMLSDGLGKTTSFANGTYEGAAMLSVALANLRGAFWVGLFEHFDASLCLLSLQLGQYQTALCSCEARRQRQTLHAGLANSQFTLGGAGAGPGTTVGQLLPYSMRTNRSRADSADLAVMQAAQERLLRLDGLLYAAAVRLFARRAKAAERRLGVRVLCPGLDDPLADLA